jgi:hypothetical protein
MQMRRRATRARVMPRVRAAALTAVVAVALVLQGHPPRADAATPPAVTLTVTDAVRVVNGKATLADSIFGVTAYEGGDLFDTGPGLPPPDRTEAAGAVWLREWGVRSVGFAAPLHW